MALSIDQKRLKATKFPPEFDTKVDIEKVNIDLMKKWIANKITTILGDEDDIVVETCYNLIEQNQFVRLPSGAVFLPQLTLSSPKSRRFRSSSQDS
jgi:serine/arginine repetitive matrix protein 1